LTEQYIFIPHKVKDVYLHHLLTTSIASLQTEQKQQQQKQQPAAAGGGSNDGSSGSSSGLPAGLGSGARSAIIFVSTCKGCKVLDQVLRELGIPAASLHSGNSCLQLLSLTVHCMGALTNLLLRLNGC
jgi:ATP-dependent RNA helicase DDX49/DBP8